jgi:hypothetical protein
LFLIDFLAENTYQLDIKGHFMIIGLIAGACFGMDHPA